MEGVRGPPTAKSQWSHQSTAKTKAGDETLLRTTKGSTEGVRGPLHPRTSDTLKVAPSQNVAARETVVM